MLIAFIDRPESNVALLCASYLRDVLEVVAASYRRFRIDGDARSLFTRDSLAALHWTVEDLERTLEFSEGWSDVFPDLAKGALTERNDDPVAASRLDILRVEAARLGVGMDAMALSAALARPWAAVVLSGAATPVQLHSNLPALTCLWDRGAEAPLSRLTLDSGGYWARWSRLQWS